MEWIANLEYLSESYILKIAYLNFPIIKYDSANLGYDVFPNYWVQKKMYSTSIGSRLQVYTYDS